MQSVLQAEYDGNTGQAPLIHIVDYDDVVLINSTHAEWFLILKDLPWERYRTYAANYYDALYEFNCKSRSPKNRRDNECSGIEQLCEARRA